MLRKKRVEESTLQWLLDSDPSIRWQVLKHLIASSKNKVLSERRKVFSGGWGAKLLSFQQMDGKWAGSLYGRKWISTTYTMLLLKNLGLMPGHKQALKACKVLLDEGIYGDGGINYFPGYEHSETCVTGIILSILAYFNYDDKIKSLVFYLLKQQMKDGGWNCQSYNGATHSSFHSTINVLEGLWEYQKNCEPRNQNISNSIKRGTEFLLIHRLFKSHRTGNIVNSNMTRFSFPTGWRYDVLRVLDFFQEYNTKRDKRLNDAIELVIKRRTDDGRWLLQNRHPGKYFFEMEEVGKPSRWNTLRALRVLKWWENN